MFRQVIAAIISKILLNTERKYTSPGLHPYLGFLGDFLVIANI
jgi:hypothetical protein